MVDSSEGTAGASPEPGHARARRRRWPIVVGVVGGLLALAYAAAGLYLGDKVPAETTVAGVHLGGLTVPAAETRLAEALGEVSGLPVTLVAGDAQASIDPAAVGLELDAEATIAQFTGLNFTPRVLLGHLVGLGERPAVSDVDEDALVAAVRDAATTLDVAPIEGAITFDGVTPVTVEPADGFRVEVEDTAAAVRDRWLFGEAVSAVTEVVEPEIGAAAVEAALTEVVEPLTSGPVTVVVGERRIEIPVDALVATSRIEADGDALVLVVDGEALRQKIYELDPELGEQPRDATVELRDGRPVVVPAVTGLGLDPAVLAEGMTEAALESGEAREVTLDLIEVEPEFTTEEAEALGIVEVVSEFSTPMPYDPVRTKNLITGTGIISGQIVKPGETFSLIEALGPITAARGFTVSHVVVDGNVAEALGGGLSQLATTTYNAAYFSGMDDVFHKPHSRWFDRYPEGREATMFTPSIDLKWRNSTDHGILVQAWVANGRTHVRFWGTKFWEVRSATGPRYNITSPRTIYNTSSTCTPESGGQSGFTVQVTRTRLRDGQVHDKKTWTTTYQPWNTVVCGPKPTATAGPAPGAEPS